jgi:hypothetical protein
VGELGESKPLLEVHDLLVRHGDLVQTDIRHAFAGREQASFLFEMESTTTHHSAKEKVYLSGAFVR